MKKIFLAILFAIMLIPSMVMAAEPEISSDSRTFNPMTGVYDLRGNVRVVLNINDTDMKITGDATQVYIYAMEVHGQGNITMVFNDMNFNCDKVDVFHSSRSAYVYGNCTFIDGATTITADQGSYNWKTKQAAFSGNVKVNGTPHDGDVAYNVITKTIIEP